MAGSVADTSVFASIFFREPKSELANKMLAGAELFEPPLLAYELASVCCKKTLLYPHFKYELFEALGLALSIDIYWVDVDHQAVVDLAIETSLTTYDSSFLWLSRELKLPLHTFDKQLLSLAD